MTRIKKKIDQLVGKMPAFMMPDMDQVETLEDFEFRVLTETDIGEFGGTDPRWTPTQVRRAKQFCMTVRAAVEGEKR